MQLNDKSKEQKEAADSIKDKWITYYRLILNTYLEGLDLNDFSTKRDFGVIFQNWRRSNAGIATDESFEKATKRSFVMKSKIEIPFFNN